MPAPWLSIVMPVFNGAAFLARALESIVREGARDDIEVLVIEDGSTDASPEILDRYARRLPLRIVAGPRRGNWAAATNVGLTAARGELACILHQDDGWLPGRLSAVRALTTEHPDAALWIHASRFHDDSDRDIGPWTCPLESASGQLESETVVQRLLVQNFIAMPGPTFRLADARRVSGLDEALWFTADWDFWLKLAELGPTAYLPRPLAFFRVHSSSQTVRRSADAADFRAQLLAAFERHAARLPASPSSRSAMRAGRLSIEINVALAGLLHGARPDLRALGGALFDVDADALRRLLRDSKLTERLAARLRARLTPPAPGILRRKRRDHDLRASTTNSLYLKARPNPRGSGNE